MEQEVTNHSDVIETPVETTETPIDTSQVPEGSEQPVTTQEPPKGLTVKYNKEERFIPDEELPQWVQKGLNYDKVQEKAKQADTYQQNLDRLARLHGYDSHDGLMKAVEETERNREIESEAKQLANRLGIDQEAAMEVIRDNMRPLKSEVTELRQKLSQYEQQAAVQTVQSIVNDLKEKYTDFEKYEQNVYDLGLKGYDLEHAYIIASHQEKAQQIKLQAEQEALQKLQQNAATSTGALGKDSPDEAFGYMSMTAAERRAFRDKVKRGQT